MKLSIYYYPKMKRKWLLVRKHGEYKQHAHFYTRKECLMCRSLIDDNKYPREEKYRIAMKRILTKKEFRKLKKPRNYKEKKNVKIVVIYKMPLFCEVKMWEYLKT